MVSGLSSSDHDRVQLDNHSDVSEENRKRTVKCHRDAPSLLADNIRAAVHHVSMTRRS